MKRIAFGFAVASFALFAGTSSAQAQRPVSFGVSAGAAMPNGDLGDAFSMGYNVTGSVGYSMPALPVSFRVDGMWNQLGEKDDSGIGARTLGVNANVVYTLPGIALRPYVIGGLGMYSSKATGEGLEDAESTTDMGINAGVGARFALSGFQTFVEARFHNIFVDSEGDESANARFIPLSFGIMF
jgi:hypothetical protein